MIFKYTEYKKYINHLKNFGKVVPLCKWDLSSAIILRHDVDFDVEAAYKLALLEMECEIRSTFFFLTSCQTYNLFSAPNRLKLSKLAEMGFEIGLHFDPTLYGDIGIDQLNEYVEQEADRLSQITGDATNSVSLHNPSIHGQYPIFKDYNNAYDSQMFSDDRYLSDSRMNFRGKDPYVFIEQAKDYPIQIVLHPLHYSEDGAGYPEIFHKFVKRMVDDIDLRFRNNSTYLNQIAGTDLFSYITKK